MKELRVRFFKTNCLKCEEHYYIYYIAPESNNIDIDIIFDKNVMNKVLEFTHNKNIKIGSIKERYSHTRKEEYMSFGCPKCDAIFGDNYLKELIFETIYEDRGDIDDIIITI